MNIYLTIMVTVLVLTQIVRIVQNTIQLRRQYKLFQAQLGQLDDITQVWYRRTNVQSAKAIRSDINKSLYTMILWCLMSCDRCAANLYGVKS